MESQDILTKVLLMARSAKGEKLSECEIGALERLAYLDALENRPAVDFAETEAYLHLGNLQRDALVAANERAARFGQKQPQPHKQFFSDSPAPQPPSSIIVGAPLGNRQTHERSMARFRARLAEAMETGRLP